MCKNIGLNEEDRETYSGYVTKKEQRAYIKIKCLRGNTVPVIIANVCEVRSYDAVNYRLDGSNNFRKEEDQWKMMHTLVTPLHYVQRLL